MFRNHRRRPFDWAQGKPYGCWEGVSPSQCAAKLRSDCRALEQIPQKLVVNVVVILHFGRFDEGSQQARATVR